MHKDPIRFSRAYSGLLCSDHLPGLILPRALARTRTLTMARTLILTPIPAHHDLNLHLVANEGIKGQIRDPYLLRNGPRDLVTRQGVGAGVKVQHAAGRTVEIGAQIHKLLIGNRKVRSAHRRHLLLDDILVHRFACMFKCLPSIRCRNWTGFGTRLNIFDTVCR